MNQVPLKTWKKKKKRKKKDGTSLATTRAPGSVDWPRLGGNSFERRSESERMENGGAPGGESSATRCSTVKWERAGVSAREEPREEEELWKHRAVTMRGKVVRLPCRSRRPSADPPRGEIHSFFRLAAEITFRHSVEKKEEEGWSLHDFESFCQMEYWIVDRDYPYPRLYSLVYSRYIVFVFS